MTLLHIVLAVLVSFIWGVNFTFIAWALESFPPLMLTALRYLSMPLVRLLCSMPLYSLPCIWVHQQV